MHVPELGVLRAPPSAFVVATQPVDFPWLLRVLNETRG